VPKIKAKYGANASSPRRMVRTGGATLCALLFPVASLKRKKSVNVAVFDWVEERAI
jgi:hypothetical protein